MHEKLVELDTLIFEAQWSEFDIVNGPEETVNGEFVSGLRPLMDGVREWKYLCEDNGALEWFVVCYSK